MLTNYKDGEVGGGMWNTENGFEGRIEMALGTTNVLICFILLS